MQLKLSQENKFVIYGFLVSFLISGAVYLYTMAPTVTFGDSGDFMTAAYGLRFAHPPGYPTYVLLAKIFTYLPFGHNIGFRINFLSVLFSTLAVSGTYFLIYWILKTFFDSQEKRKNILYLFSAVAGALIFAFSGTFWSQSGVAKIHPVNASFTVAILFCLLFYYRSNELRYWYTGVLLWGISLGNHHTTLLYAPAAILFLLLTGKWKQVFSPKALLTGLALALLGFSVYLLLPLVTPRIGMIEWGKADSWKGFRDIVLRTDYWKFELSRSWDIAYGQLASAIAVLLTGQSTSIVGLIYGVIVVLCSLFGFSWLIQKNKPMAILFGGIALLVWLFFGAVNNHPMTRQLSLETREVFFIPAYLIYGLCAGIGIARIGISLLKEEVQRKKVVPLYLFSSFFFLVLPITGFWVQFSKHNEHNYYLAHDFGKNLLDTMEPNALFIGDDDMHIFPVWYLQQVEHYRTDVIVLSRTALYKRWYYEGLRRISYPNLQVPVFDSSQVPKDFIPAQTYLDRQMFQFFADNIKTHSNYFYLKYPLKVKPNLAVTQVGLIYQVTEKPLDNVVLTELFPYFPPKNTYQFRVSENDIIERDFWRSWALERISNYHFNQGLYQLHLNNLIAAENEFKQAVQLQPENISAHYQLGLLYQNLGKLELAKEEYTRVLFLDRDYTDAKQRLSDLSKDGKN